MERNTRLRHLYIESTNFNSFKQTMWHRQNLVNFMIVLNIFLKNIINNFTFFYNICAFYLNLKKTRDSDVNLHKHFRVFFLFVFFPFFIFIFYCISYIIPTQYSFGVINHSFWNALTRLGTLKIITSIVYIEKTSYFKEEKI